MTVLIDSNPVDPNSTPTQRVNSLTHREAQIARLSLDGLTNREMATALSISFRTVEVHRRHIMQKLLAKTGAHMARIYIEGVTETVLA